MGIIFCIRKHDTLIRVLLLILLFAGKVVLPCFVLRILPPLNGFISKDRACELYTQTFHQFPLLLKRSNWTNNINDDVQLFYFNNNKKLEKSSLCVLSDTNGEVWQEVYHLADFYEQI